MAMIEEIKITYKEIERGDIIRLDDGREIVVSRVTHFHSGSVELFGRDDKGQGWLSTRKGDYETVKIEQTS